MTESGKTESRKSKRMELRRNRAGNRRASALVMVVGILAMLFIIGSTLLVVSRFESKTVEQKKLATLRGGDTESQLDSILQQLRKEVVGDDATPYNLGWNAPGIPNTGDKFPPGEKYATYPGLIESNQVPNERQRELRSGSLVLASSEPYDDGNGNWLYFATSWYQLFELGGTGPRREYSIPASTQWGQPDQDADGDGVPDTRSPITTTDFPKYLRVISNGGMVLLDPLTHPTLLAQVIHPRDLPSSVTSAAPGGAQGVALQNFVRTLYRVDPSQSTPLRTDLHEYEAGLRRRWCLAENLNQTQLANLPANDMRQLLPFTLGFEANTPYTASTDWTPHWRQVDPAQTDGTRTDADWWKDRLHRAVSGQFALALTDKTPAAYNAGADNYDRRHLITTTSSDNLLRPRRDENRLSQFIGDSTNTGIATLRDVIAPTETTTQWGYGFLPQLAPASYQLLFNTPSARTQFSLRDLLSEWPIDGSTGDYIRDASNNPIPAGQVIYRRVIQLASAYLAMIQHTNLGTDLELRSYLSNSTALLKEQLEAAFQLAVNTIDFADNDVPVISPAPATLPTDDPPTRIRWTQPLGIDPTSGSTVAGTGFSIDVVGVERHPYITEAYAKIVQRPKLGTVPADWNPVVDDPADGPPESIYAVELYNPYDVPLDLSHYDISLGTAGPLNLNLSNVVIQPFSYLVIANQSADANFADYSGGTGPPTIAVKNPFIPGITPAQVAAAGSVAAGSSPAMITVGPAFVIPRGVAIQLVRKDVLEVSHLGVTYDTAPNPPVVVDQLAPIGDGSVQETWLSAKPTTWARPRLVQDVNGYATGCPTSSDDLTLDPAKNTFIPANPGSPPFLDIRRPGRNLDNTVNPFAPSDTADRLIRDYSLQRHKEAAGVPPKYWHATLGVQILAPIYPQYEYNACANQVPDDRSCPAHHNLLLSTPSAPLPPTQGFVADYFLGLPRAHTTANNISVPMFPLRSPIAGVPVLLSRALPETPHPHGNAYNNVWDVSFLPTPAVRVVFNTLSGATDVAGAGAVDSNGNPPSSAGTDPTAGTSWLTFAQAAGTPPLTGVTLAYSATAPAYGIRVTQVLDANTGLPVRPRAFPTTGSLLLVSRYANLPGAGGRPASTAAASLPPGVNRPLVQNDFTTTNTRPGQLQRADNGHLPLWDELQTCTDNSRYDSTSGVPSQWLEAQGAFDMPWGQLVHNYFTVLPLEELFHYRNLTGIPDARFSTMTNVRLVDLAPELYNIAYEWLFQGLPVVEPVPGPNGPLVGPKVRGRININTAPWWVLDGLPLLAWSAVPSTELNPLWSDPTAAAAAPRFDRFDGQWGGAGVPYDRLPGLLISTETSDEDAAFQQLLDQHFNWGSRRNPPPLDLPSISPTLARGMVAYRENRLGFEGVGLVKETVRPGFLSVGQVADTLWRMNHTITDAANTTVTASTVTFYDPEVTSPPAQLGIRDFVYPDMTNPLTRDYAHLGYLQLVTPLVRLQDWATVKDHVFTIYMTQKDPSKGNTAVWTHTEVTVDRTRCLYTNDLPAIVAETPPVNYYNVVDDQKK